MIRLYRDTNAQESYILLNKHEWFDFDKTIYTEELDGTDLYTLTNDRESMTYMEPNIPITTLSYFA